MVLETNQQSLLKLTITIRLCAQTSTPFAAQGTVFYT